MSTCACVRPTWAATAATVGSSSRRPFVSGLYASTTMPSSTTPAQCVLAASIQERVHLELVHRRSHGRVRQQLVEMPVPGSS